MGSDELITKQLGLKKKKKLLIYDDILFPSDQYQREIYGNPHLIL